MMEPGLHTKVGFKDYCGIDAVNKSLCGVYYERGSMAAVRHAMLNPKPPSAAMRLGTIIHAMLLESDTTEHRMVVGGPKKTVNAGKANERTWELSPDSDAFAEWAAALEAEGKIGVHTDEWATVEATCAAVEAHPNASELVLRRGAYRESTLVWDVPVSLVTGEVVNVRCKGRPDLIRPDMRCEVDIKTTSRPLTEAFMRSTVLNWTYYIQAAAYLEGLAKVFDTSESWDFIIVFVPESEPLTPVVRMLDPEWFAPGLDRWHRFLAEYAQCRRVNLWPGPDAGWTADNGGAEPVYPGLTQLRTLRAPEWLTRKTNAFEAGRYDDIIF